MEFARIAKESERTPQQGMPFYGDPWQRWGPYLSERAWGTVREDYSADGSAWEYFPHDMARSRAYRWNEDGLAGISDEKGHLCFALALWNGQDPILKERLFGLTGNEGNHGEDVKEMYFYLDSTPSHSYMRMLYRYPQAAFPYQALIEENARRSRLDPEFELPDTGIFADDRFFDVFVEYAKAAPEDILIRVSAVNRGSGASHPAPLAHPLVSQHLVVGPGRPTAGAPASAAGTQRRGRRLNPGIYHRGGHHLLGNYLLVCEAADDLLFTENETNAQRLFGAPNAAPYREGCLPRLSHSWQPSDAVNPARTGTKAAALYTRTIAAGATLTLRLRLTSVPGGSVRDETEASHALQACASRRAIRGLRRALRPAQTGGRRVLRRPAARATWTRRRAACSGRPWRGCSGTSSSTTYVVEQWLEGDPAQPTPPPQRRSGRNAGWRHLYNERVMSMPDKWEYPWYASWDLAFHCLPLALLDSTFAKSQLDLLLREWYHASQRPASRL